MSGQVQVKTGSLSQGLLWFGAAVSIAEILTGALLAPLGFGKGLLAIVAGHVIGCGIFYFTGLIGARSGLGAIESTRISFGRLGSHWFALLNIIQLLGWTAVMIVNGAKALDAVTPFLRNQAVWCVVIGGLICMWIVVGMKNLGKLNAVIVTCLFACTIILGVVVFRGMDFSAAGSGGAIGFGAAVELSVTMPLSWLPLVSDYTRSAKNPVGGARMSTAGYFLGSCMMYIIGLGAAIYTGTDDIAAILLGAGLGVVALFIVVFSTVTTTFLDAYSGGVSIVSLTKSIGEKPAGILVCALGTLMAVTIPTTQYENFLYLIGSVFAPLFAVLITDYYLLKRTEIDAGLRINPVNMAIWAVGVAVYRLLLNIDSPLGTSLPTMVLVALLCLLIHKLKGMKAYARQTSGTGR